MLVALGVIAIVSLALIPVALGVWLHLLYKRVGHLERQRHDVSAVLREDDVRIREIAVHLGGVTRRTEQLEDRLQPPGFAPVLPSYHLYHAQQFADIRSPGAPSLKEIYRAARGLDTPSPTVRLTSFERLLDQSWFEGTKEDDLTSKGETRLILDFEETPARPHKG